MTNLAQKKCVPCDGEVAPLTREETQPYLAEVKNWMLADDAKSISKKVNFPDFKSALDFVNQIGELAETNDHHPNLKLGWGYVNITFSTHSIRGLSENDFILAAKIDELRR
jgi:4a-hydroxytetrahydrobiopterin dehydratase